MYGVVRRVEKCGAHLYASYAELDRAKRGVVHAAFTPGGGARCAARRRAMTPTSSSAIFCLLHSWLRRRKNSTNIVKRSYTHRRRTPSRSLLHARLLGLSVLVHLGGVHRRGRRFLFRFAANAAAAKSKQSGEEEAHGDVKRRRLKWMDQGCLGMDCAGKRVCVCVCVCEVPDRRNVFGSCSVCVHRRWLQHKRLVLPEPNSLSLRLPWAPSSR